MGARDEATEELELEVAGQDNLSDGAPPEYMETQLLHIAGKESRGCRESKKDGGAQPDRGVQDTDEPDNQDHPPTLQKACAGCQVGKELGPGPCVRDSD